MLQTECKAPRSISAVRERDLSPGGSAGQCASFNCNASAFLAFCFRDLTSASVLVAFHPNVIKRIISELKLHRLNYKL